MAPWTPVAKGLRSALDLLRAGRQGQAGQPTRPTQWVPGRWASYTFGPGQPIVPSEAEQQPRAFEYIPGVNLTRVPRIGYGLMPYSQLKLIFETVTEVQIPVHILLSEMLSFAPQLVDEQGNALPERHATKLAWTIERPDGHLTYSSWLKRFLFNTLVYDAPSVHLDRDAFGQINCLRIVDGSTFFAIVNELGEIPRAPEPAYTQFIWGIERGMYTQREVWNSPFWPVPWAPYGWTPIDRAWPWISMLSRLFSYELGFYTEGNTPEAMFRAPPNLTVQQVLDLEAQYNSQQVGDPGQRRRIRFMPAGSGLMQVKQTPWPDPLYEAAREQISLSFGVPVSEQGKTPGQGLGGKGFQDRQQSAFWRMGIAPLKQGIEEFYRDVYQMMGYSGVRMNLQMPGAGMDPLDEAAKLQDPYAKGAVTINEYRSKLGFDPVNGGDKHMFFTTSGVVDLTPYLEGQASLADIQPRPALTVSTNGKASSNGHAPGHSVEAQALSKAWSSSELMVVLKHCGVCPEDDAYYGARIEPVSAPFLHTGANDNCLVRLLRQTASGGQWTVPGIFKPVSGESEILREAVSGPLAYREEAAYLLDRLLGFRLVPVSYVADLDGLIGSVQYYVRSHEEPREAMDYAGEWREAAGLFDWLCQQFDRHRGNFFTHPDEPERPILIDNSLSFSPHRAHSPFLVSVLGDLSDWLLLAVHRALEARAEGDWRWERLEELIGSGQLRALLTRLQVVQGRSRIGAVTINQTSVPVASTSISVSS